MFYFVLVLFIKSKESVGSLSHLVFLFFFKYFCPCFLFCWSLYTEIFRGYTDTSLCSQFQPCPAPTFCLLAQTCGSFNHTAFTFFFSLSLSTANTIIFTLPSLCILKKIFLQDGWIICSGFDIEGLPFSSHMFMFFFRLSLVLIFFVCVWVQALPTVKNYTDALEIIFKAIQKYQQTPHFVLLIMNNSYI